jgi:hypothetical protein
MMAVQPIGEPIRLGCITLIFLTGARRGRQENRQGPAETGPQEAPHASQDPPSQGLSGVDNRRKSRHREELAGFQTSRTPVDFFASTFFHCCICTSPDAGYGCLATTKWRSNSRFSGEVGHAKVAVVDDCRPHGRQRLGLLLQPDRRRLLPLSLRVVLEFVLQIRGLEAAIAVRLPYASAVHSGAGGRSDL